MNTTEKHFQNQIMRNCHSFVKGKTTKVQTLTFPNYETWIYYKRKWLEQYIKQ